MTQGMMVGHRKLVFINEPEKAFSNFNACVQSWNQKILKDSNVSLSAVFDESQFYPEGIRRKKDLSKEI
jgi:hypothetical protein